ncbi:MAG: permease prefix domain 1-containing protein [Fimbriimonas sp.]
MNQRLDAYLSDLEGKLRSQIDDARRDEIIAELRFHLTMSARDAQAELEMEPDEATKAALRALGSVENVAEDLVRQHRGGTAQSEWHVARFQVLLYVLLCILIPALHRSSAHLILFPSLYASGLALHSESLLARFRGGGLALPPVAGDVDGGYDRRGDPGDDGTHALADSKDS